MRKVIIKLTISLILVISLFCVLPKNAEAVGGALPPIGLVAKDNSIGNDYSVQLIWPSTIEGSVDKYKVYRKDGAGTYTLLSTLEKLETAYTDQDVTANSEYTYIIKGFLEDKEVVTSTQATIILSQNNQTGSGSTGPENWLSQIGVYNIFAVLLVILLVVYLFFNIKRRRVRQN